MPVTDITTITGSFLDEGCRYRYEASFNARAPVAWKADIQNAAGWSCRLAGALIDDSLSGPRLRSAVTSAIAAQIRTTLADKQADGA